MSKLAVHSLKQHGWKDTIDGMENVIRHDFVSIFPALKRVTVKTVDSDNSQCRMKLESLARAVESIDASVEIAICDDDQWIQKVMIEQHDITEVFHEMER